MGQIFEDAFLGVLIGSLTFMAIWAFLAARGKTDKERSLPSGATLVGLYASNIIVAIVAHGMALNC